MLPNNESQRSLLLLGIFLGIYFSILACLAVTLPLWHDERHFIDTILLFKHHPSLSTLIYYNEMSTPLPFALYALWAAVFGETTAALRAFSLLTAFSSLLVYYRLFSKVSRSPRTAALLTVFLVCNPYMIGTCVLIYTDMLMIFFAGLFLIAVLEKKTVLLVIAACGGTLCRQYFIFLPIAGALYFFLEYLSGKERAPLLRVAAIFLSQVPLAVLFLLWQGISPKNELRVFYMQEGITYHASSAVYYIILLFVFLFPVVIVFWKRLYLKRSLLLASLLAGWIYWLWPVKPLPITFMMGLDRVGYFHLALQTWPGGKGMHWIFFFLFFLAMPLFLRVLTGMFCRILQRQSGTLLFLEITIIAFFAIMPFSYLLWEKYFLPLVPVCALYFVLIGRKKAAFEQETPALTE